MHFTISLACQCSAFEGSIKQHGPSVTAGGEITNLTFTECGTSHTTVNKPGSLQSHGNGNGSGTLTWSGAEITMVIETIFGKFTCIFTTNNTHLGTITVASSDMGHALLDIDSAAIPRTGGSALCGSSAEWTGSYRFTAPTGLRVD